MKHASLFSGIGGFDLAAEWVGWENIFHCEWNIFGKRVLNYYWPKAKSYDDITKTDFTEWRGKIDILTGGFPCQPYSVAGKRLGKEDERHLWPHMLRAIQEIQPRYVVGENVRGLISWNGGLVFDEVQSDLEAEGYTVIPCVLPACGVNAPHRRERVWFIAYRDAADTNSQRYTSCGTRSEVEGFGRRNDGESEVRSEQTQRDNGLLGFQRNAAPYTDNARNTASRSGIIGDWTENIIERELAQPESDRYADVTDTESFGNRELRQQGSEERSRCGNVLLGIEYRISSEERHVVYSDNQRCEEQHLSRQSIEPVELNRRFDADRTNWENFPTQPPICGGDDGLSRELDGITFPKWRSESIKAYGNAIVPVVAYEIFKVINKLDRELLRYL